MKVLLLHIMTEKNPLSSILEAQSGGESSSCYVPVLRWEIAVLGGKGVR